MNRRDFFRRALGLLGVAVGAKVVAEESKPKPLATAWLDGDPIDPSKVYWSPYAKTWTYNYPSGSTEIEVLEAYAMRGIPEAQAAGCRVTTASGNVYVTYPPRETT